jgi:hypothetical protein
MLGLAVLAAGCGKEKAKALASFDAYVVSTYPGTKWSSDGRNYDSCELVANVLQADGGRGYDGVLTGKLVSWYPETTPLMTMSLLMVFHADGDSWKCDDAASSVGGDGADIFATRPCKALPLYCQGKAPPEVARPKITIAYPESTDGLKAELTDFLGTWASKDGDRARAIMASLHMPDAEAWFKATWGDAAGSRLSSEYAQNARYMDEMQHVVMKLAQDGVTEVSVQRFDRTGDPDETKYQSEALRAMKAPVPLYSVRITRPGHRLGQHFYSFVYRDGTFRLIGKTKHLSGGPEPTKEVDALSELRMRDAKVYLKTGKLPED